MDLITFYFIIKCSLIYNALWRSETMNLNQPIREIVDSLTGETVKITIGSGFHLSVYCKLLLLRALWFERAFTKNFHEADIGYINFRETEIED